MMRRMLALSALVICGLCLPASAGEGYVGASYMSSTAELQSGLTKVDADSSGWKVFGGFNLIKYFGVELSYYDLGSFTETSGATAFDGSVKVLDLSGRGILPIGQRIELFARLGYSQVNFDVTTSTGGVFSAGIDTTDWELMAGLGIGFKIGQRFGIRAEYETWDVATSLDAWSVGAYFRFGGN